jgi:hypothetical protein
VKSKSELAREYYAKHREALGHRRRELRRSNVARAILADTRRADNRRGRANDLDLAFIDENIKLPCSYCGDAEIRRSLDRIDNSLGHLRENVVVACERCNYLRRDMPYPAWLVVAKAMRQARLKGLFGGWTGGIHRRLQLVPPATSLPGHQPKPLQPHGTIARYLKCGPPTCQLCRDAMASWKRGRRKLGP